MMDNIDDQLYKEQLPNIGVKLREGFRALCRSATILNKFPVLKWLPRYQLNYLFGDLIAGFTVGLTTIPQAIAYGIVAGLEPQYGLYSAFMGSFTYIVFGSCKDVTIATTAIMAIMVSQYTALSPDYPVLLSFLVGCIILLLGLLNLGVLVQFISIPVLTGFVLAAATTIGSAQINNLFGLASPSKKLLPAWKFFFTHLPLVSTNDTILGILTLTFLLALKRMKNNSYGSKLFWKYLALSRNALAVIIGSFVAYHWSSDGSPPFRVTGNITAGLPPFELPPFSTTVNGTHVSFGEMISTVSASLISIPLVATLEVMAISKAFSKGKIVNASQEMVALGMCNIMGSFVRSMPVTGSFTRTAVNNASGVCTTLGGAVTGTLVLMALAFLTDTFYYIPKSTLAAVIIAAMLSIVEFNVIVDIWRSKKRDLVPFSVTALVGMYWSLEYGILLGIAINLMSMLYETTRPRITITSEKVDVHDVVIVNMRQGLDYAAAEFLREEVVKYVMQLDAKGRLIVLKGTNTNTIDYTVASNIVTLKEDIEILGGQLICWNWPLAAAGVVCRLNRQLRTMFVFQGTLHEVVSHFLEDLRTESSSTVCTVSN